MSLVRIETRNLMQICKQHHRKPASLLKQNTKLRHCNALQCDVYEAKFHTSIKYGGRSAPHLEPAGIAWELGSAESFAQFFTLRGRQPALQAHWHAPTKQSARAHATD